MAVMRNPDRAAVAEALERFGYLRALKDRQAGDVYLWPGGEALHEEMIRRLGLSPMTENKGQIMSLHDLRRLED